MHHIPEDRPARPLIRLLIATATAIASSLPAAPAASQEQPSRAPHWAEVELTFTADRDHPDPYPTIELFADFEGPDGRSLRRPAFWDGERTWKIRFASPISEGSWAWTTSCSDPDDDGLHGRTGTLEAASADGDTPFSRHGLLRMSPERRNVVHADGTPFLLVADTPWALPFRGTVESVTTYARDRREKGFNAALLMSVQPDREATGPRDRSAEGGFDVAFEDLPEGHLNRLNVDYFRTLDDLTRILVDHGIAPVYNPVFHGFGWKGQKVAGPVVPPEEYARYCRYLVARYGALPAFWLVSADAKGRHAPVAPGGREIEAWDSYDQPTGIHYAPKADDKAH